jgi:hypothetical protein
MRLRRASKLRKLPSALAIADYRRIPEKSDCVLAYNIPVQRLSVFLALSGATWTLAQVVERLNQFRTSAMLLRARYFHRIFRILLYPRAEVQTCDQRWLRSLSPRWLRP